MDSSQLQDVSATHTATVRVVIFVLYGHQSIHIAVNCAYYAANGVRSFVDRTVHSVGAHRLS